MRLTYVRNLWS